MYTVWLCNYYMAYLLILLNNIN